MTAAGLEPAPFRTAALTRRLNHSAKLPYTVRGYPVTQKEAVNRQRPTVPCARQISANDETKGKFSMIYQI